MDTQSLHFIQEQHPYPLLFVTVTGSHAFNMASPTSDYDSHGVHILPLKEVLGNLIGQPHETVERKDTHSDGLEVDIATHDLKKFCYLLLKGNGSILEDLYSPLVVLTSPIHEELKELGKGCFTKHLAHHYKGMALTQQRRLKSNELKKVIHMYRCLLMGIHLMRTGELVMDVPRLADEYTQPQLNELIAFKCGGFDFVPDGRLEQYLTKIAMLAEALDSATMISPLPEHPSARYALEDLIVRVRLAHG